MLSDKLKEETKSNHQQLEKVMVGKLRAIRSKEEYADVLKLFYGYFGGLEMEINKVIDASLLPDNADRRKTQSLADDLQSLGAAVPVKASGDDLPVLTSHLQAIGALYVIEGSTLGGKIISKMMQQQLALRDNELTFFTSYGNNTEQMWDAFKDALNYQATNPEQEAVVIAAANQTFLKFGEWFKSRSS
ncbi:biliverdin-producing heme oxygenase [Mucilaginibacter sp.]|uniref:biliverdin-producing heme oxygenase n=1 Tax=Mucilaginibacter sp. TaxID=1882438 RepID=UPI0035BC8684